MKKHGAVVGDPSSGNTATMEMEVLYIDNFSTETWANVGVGLNSLQVITLDTTNFTFAQHGFSGPTYSQWYARGGACEADPG